MDGPGFRVLQLHSCATRLTAFGNIQRYVSLHSGSMQATIEQLRYADTLRQDLVNVRVEEMGRCLLRCDVPVGTRACW